MDSINDGLRAKEIVSQDYDKANLIHSRLKPGYFITNEQLDYISKFDINSKKVLSVCGSGDQAFMCLINGAESVDTFDYNPLQYYLLELKIAAIKTFDKETYLKFFPLVGGDIRENYNIKYYLQLYDQLSEDAKKFWDIVYSAERPDIYLLNKFSYSINFSSDYTKNYDLLKTRLLENPINFKLGDAFSINEEFNDKYSLIILSNIFDHLKLKLKNYSEKDYLLFVRDKVLPLLDENGTCVFHYQFRCDKHIDVSNFNDYESVKCNVGDYVKVLRKS